MKLSFLGGANEVGASATLIEIADHRILVDCGIRMGGEAECRTPDFSLLNDARPEAVILTHAHMDHSGALPLLMAAIPGIPLYATPPTVQLLKILFADALKIMGDKEQEDIPLYSEAMVENTLNRLVEIPFDHPQSLCNGDVQLIFRPAGHILGAATATIETSRGRVLFTGDFATANQKSVSGAVVPRGSYDVVVTESTYGGRFHPPRRDEEKRLANMVADAVKGGGFVLIPAFAIGRAQEIILILSEAMDKGEIPEFPVYVDGMVTRVCHVYRDFPNDVAPGLAKRIKRLSHPFFPAESPVKPVYSPKDRNAVFKGPPGAIISSSGMLTGGPSVYYASEIAGKKGSLIAITGYQDEESPGRKLLDLAETTEPTRSIRLGQTSIPVHCTIDRFGLSAHADAQEIARFTGSAKSPDVVLVHGDEKAREDLWALMRSVLPETEVHLPKCGESLEISDRRRKKTAVPVRIQVMGLANDRFPTTETDLELLKQHILERYGPERFHTSRELFNIFSGTERFALDAFETFRTLLRTSGHFSPRKGGSYLFKPVAASVASKSGKAKPGGGRLEQNAAIKTAAAMFGPDDHLLKCGIRLDLEPPAIVLFFAFPEVAAIRCVETISKVRAITGYQILIHPEANPPAMVLGLKQLLPPGFTFARNPSFHRELKVLRIKTRTESEAALIQGVQTVFRENTGFRLEIEMISPASLGNPHRITPDGRMEINAVFEMITRAFAEFPGSLQKKSRRQSMSGEYIELGFVTPKAAEKHHELLEKLRIDTGWVIEVSPSINQQVLMDMARRFAAEAGTLAPGSPAIHLSQKKVEVRITAMARAESLEALATRFFEETGFTLTMRK